MASKRARNRTCIMLLLGVSWFLVRGESQAQDLLDEPIHRSPLRAEKMEAVGQARRIAAGLKNQRRLQSQRARPTKTLYLFLTLRAPGLARLIQSGRDFEGRYPEVRFEPVLLMDLERLKQITGRVKAADHPMLFRELAALTALNESFQIVGTVPVARRFQVTQVPAWVLVQSGRADKIHGTPNQSELEEFYETVRQ